MTFRTALCDLLGIDYPIVQSGMGAIAGPELVAGDQVRHDRLAARRPLKGSDQFHGRPQRFGSRTASADQPRPVSFNGDLRPGDLTRPDRVGRIELRDQACDQLALRPAEDVGGAVELLSLGRRNAHVERGVVLVATRSSHADILISERYR